MQNPAINADQSANHHHEIKPADIIIGVIIGRTSEFFDFFVYAIASVIVFPKLIFSQFDPLTAMLYSFAFFALAFIARPLGSIIFMEMDRIYGRGVKLISAILLLGTSTVAMGFLPAYEDVGSLAILLLALCRIGQGLAWGGSWDGMASLLAVNIKENKYGWYAMIPQLGAMIGIILSSALFAYFIGSLSATDFMDWGWRYPFFVAFSINIVALFARLTIVQTPEFKKLYETRELKPAPLIETFSKHPKTVLLGALAPLASFALLHMVTTFPLSYLFLFTEQSPIRFLVIEIVGALIGLICVVCSGYIANQIGRRTLLSFMAVAIASFSGFAPQLLDQGITGEVAYVIIGFILLGLSFGQTSGVTSRSFPKFYRYTGSAIISDLAWLFGAGFAPLVALWLTLQFGILMAGAYLLSGAVATIIALQVYKAMIERQNAQL